MDGVFHCWAAGLQAGRRSVTAQPNIRKMNHVAQGGYLKSPYFVVFFGVFHYSLGSS